MKQNVKLNGVKTAVWSDSIDHPNLSMGVLGRLNLLFFNLVRSLTPLKRHKVAIVGTGETAWRLRQFFQVGKYFAYDFVGFFDVEGHLPTLKGDISDLKKYCLENEIDQIYFARSTQEKSLIEDLAQFADENFIYFRIAGQKQALAATSATATYFFDDIPVMGLRREPLASRFNQGLKRAFDIVFSLCVLAILVPFVFPIIALAIRLESRGPIFFVMPRSGYKNKPFNCYKFRSMRVNNDVNKQATKNDARITKVGAFLRKTSLDELPQFINVLKGEMSVVGPRPHIVKQLEYYSNVVDKYCFRHFVMPGITGYAQVNGYRGETKTDEMMAKRVAYDIAYMEKWSFWFDLKIVFLTAWNIIVGEENAY
ncbi:MAG: exopolysaccharide biosynthesis polyprenyl glycosylphosphotransferase [Bacteroidia bacterium]|nr:exopolysaccharide biosynthesis polyprenyl glycosylphosphotransferase [Bacteroidia bacterium]